jgi:2-polyprenyl-3-methyl-5-hydroxy-6-metoxy-1,4-benzoquinol methylase
MAAFDRGSPGGYFLKRDWAALSRLTLQHYLYRELFEFLIHPDIVAVSSLGNQGIQKLLHTDGPLQILDFATGNGVWALDVARKFSAATSNIHITALDISSDQFPPKETWPENVTFATHNVFDDVPTQYLEKFDIVHVRLLAITLFRPDAPDVVGNVAKMLKKGGWLQWQEIGMPTFSRVVFDSAKAEGVEVDEGHTPMVRMLDQYTPIVKNCLWINELDKVVAEKGGLVDVRLLRSPTRKEMLRTETEVVAWSLREGGEGFTASMPTEEKKEEFRALLRDEIDGIARGMLYTFNGVMAVGRKP